MIPHEARESPENQNFDAWIFKGRSQLHGVEVEGQNFRRK